MTQILLHMPLDQLHDPDHLDIGPQRRAVAVQGTPTAVVDDRLGAAIQLDEGDALSVTLADLGTDAAQELTLSIWVAPRIVPTGPTVLLALGDPDSGGVALMAGPVRSAEVGLFLSSAGTQGAIVPVPLGTWRHLSVIRSAGDWQLLIDAEHAQSLGDTRDLSDTTLRLGALAGATGIGAVDMAQLRVVNTALNAAQLSAQSEADQTAFGAFQEENPLNVRLLDPGGAPNIYIGKPHSLVLELQNQGSQDLVLRDGPSVGALRFFLPVGTLHPDMLRVRRPRAPHPFAILGKDWTTKVAQNASGVTATITPNVDMTLAPGETRVLGFGPIRAEPGFGTRPVRSLLEYDATVGGAAVSGTRTHLLNVINQVGLADAPLHAEIVSSNQLPAGGTTTLAIRLTNTSSRDILFEDRDGAARLDDDALMPEQPSSTLTIVLPRDVGAGSPTPNAVLAENGAPTLPVIPGWDTEMRTDVPWACWLRITPKGGNRVLGGGQWLDIELTDLPVSAQRGPGLVRVIHSHVPGFWYGDTELTLRKARLSHDEGGARVDGFLTVSGGETHDATAYFRSGKNEDGSARACYLSFYPGDAKSSIVQVNDHAFNINSNLDKMHIGMAGTGHLYHRDGYFRQGRDERVTWTKDGVTIFPKLTVQGDVTVNGVLSATNKQFAIPHPLDPEAQLFHAVIESPESAVSYRGTGHLQDGQARIELPRYFEALTVPGSATVHLTAKGPTPFLLSAGEVTGGHAMVYGSVPEGGFAWEVRATRKDAAFEIEPERGA